MEVQSVRCPSSIEKIGNPRFQEIVRRVFVEKTATPCFLGTDGKEVPIRLNKSVVRKLWWYMNDVIKIATNGVKEGDSKVGYAFELMVGEAVRELYRGQPNFKVFYAPALLDFQSSLSSGIDIVGGFDTGSLIIPFFFINTKLSREKHHYNGYNGRSFLGVPVSVLEGNQLFEDSGALASRFIRETFPQHFASDIARAYGSKIHKYVKFRS